MSTASNAQNNGAVATSYHSELDEDLVDEEAGESAVTSRIEETEEEEVESPILDREGRRRINRAFASHSVQKSGWVSRAWEFVRGSLENIAAMACSMTIGAIFALPLTPLVIDVARHFGYVGFFAYHWSRIGLWFGHYSDTTQWWYILTSLVLGGCIFGCVSFSGRAR
jgi:hypothetical protein